MDGLAPAQAAESRTQGQADPGLPMRTRHPVLLLSVYTHQPGDFAKSTFCSSQCSFFPKYDI